MVRASSIDGISTHSSVSALEWVFGSLTVDGAGLYFSNWSGSVRWKHIGTGSKGVGGGGGGGCQGCGRCINQILPVRLRCGHGVIGVIGGGW